MPTDRQEGRFVEEVEFVVQFFDLVFGNVLHVHRGDLKHLAGAFTVAGRDHRRIDVQKAIFLEELMDRVRDAVANASNCAEGVGSRTKVSPFAKLLHRVTFLLKRIGFWIGPAVDFDFRCEDFCCLAFATGFFDFTNGRDAATSSQAFDVVFVIAKFCGSDDLDVALARAIVDLDKAESGFGVAPCAYPAADFGGIADG